MKILLAYICVHLLNYSSMLPSHTRGTNVRVNVSWKSGDSTHKQPRHGQKSKIGGKVT